VDTRPAVSEHLQSFSAFQHTLSSLSLTRVLITWSAFAALVGYFPHLRNLEIREMSLEVESHPAPRLSCPLRGRLHLTCGAGREPFIDRLIGLNLEYEELVLVGDYEYRLVAAVGNTLKYLKLILLYRMLHCHIKSLTAYTNNSIPQ
jgi:hypothetical protein